MIKEFKDFAVRGNAVDLAVGVVIGAGFGKIVDSLVNDIIMPPFGLVAGKVDFSNLYVNLSDKAYPSLAAAKAAGAPTLNYGLFINSVINFVIISFVIFLIVRQMNKFRARPQAIVTKTCPFCQSTIHAQAKRCPECTSELVSP